MSSAIADYLSGIFTSEVSWGIICHNIRTIAFQMYERKKYEVAWTGNITNIIPEDKLTYFIIEDFQMNFKDVKNSLNDFEDYKHYIHSIAEKTLNRLFHEYLTLLKKKHQKAWEVFLRILRIRCFRWLSQQKSVTDDHKEDLFGEGIKRFYEKFKSNNLKFENSYKLKSYFFKIVDLITKEDHRKNRSFHIDDTIINALDAKNSGELKEFPGFEDEDFSKLKKAMASLSKIERIILHRFYFEGKHLKDIARELGLTEENCRVMKHRALKKLKRFIKKR